MNWLVLAPIVFGCLHYIGSWVRSYKDKPHVAYEICAVLWFILAVLIYGVFK